MRQRTFSLLLLMALFLASAFPPAIALGFETEAVDGALPLLPYFIVGATAVALIAVGALILRRRVRKKQ